MKYVLFYDSAEDVLEKAAAHFEAHARTGVAQRQERPGFRIKGGRHEFDCASSVDGTTHRADPRDVDDAAELGAGPTATESAATVSSRRRGQGSMVSPQRFAEIRRRCAGSRFRM
jgi:hypothetical protein